MMVTSGSAAPVFDAKSRLSKAPSAVPCAMPVALVIRAKFGTEADQKKFGVPGWLNTK